VRIFVPIKQRPIRGKAYRNLARPEVFPFKQEENRRWDDICCSGCSAFRSLFWCWFGYLVGSTNSSHPRARQAPTIWSCLGNAGVW